MQYFYLITLLKNTENTTALKYNLIQALQSINLILPTNKGR